MLVIIGTALAYLTTFTGDMAAELVTEVRPDLGDLIGTHAVFAGITTAIFTVLTVAYAVRLTTMFAYDKKPFFQKPEVIKLWKPLMKVADSIRRPLPSRILSLLGIVTITITGSLGAAIVYGPNIDPMVEFIYNLFLGLFF